MTTTTRRRAAIAVPLCLLVALTAALRVQQEEVVIELEGVSFVLETAGSAEPGWFPTETDWHAGDAPVTIDLQDDTPEPGVPVETRVALRNTAGVPAAVVLSFVDPDPSSSAGLFDALRVEVLEDGLVLADGPAPSVSVPLDGDLAADRAEERVLDVRIYAPVTGDDRWAGTRTGVQVLVDGMTL